MPRGASGGVVRTLRDYAQLAGVIGAAAVGLAWPAPARTLDAHGAINVVLAVLVFAAALTVPTGVRTRLHRHGLRLVAVTILTSIAVVGVAWVVAHLVPAGPERLGVIAAGLAPVEIATLGVTPLARGDLMTSGVMLIVSTVFCAVAAGPLLVVLAEGADLHSVDLIVVLVVVVLLPALLGLVGRPHVPPSVRSYASTVAAVAVVVLVWLIAAQAHLSRRYVAVGIALVVLIVVGAAIGWVIGGALTHPARVSAVFAGSMRDFAVASGIAVAAFGDSAGGPLGLYGILVMVWGTGAAAQLRRRRPRA
jgi:predicted Na+-dependent transporter